MFPEGFLGDHCTFVPTCQGRIKETLLLDRHLFGAGQERKMNEWGKGSCGAKIEE